MKGKKKKGSRRGPVPLGGRKGSHTLGSPRDISQDRKGALEAPWRAQQPVCGRQSRDLHRWSVPQLCMPQPKTHVCWYRLGLGAETQGLGDRPREKTGVGCMETA